MPFNEESADKHKKGLSDPQKKKWAKIANGVLRTCLAENKSEGECDGRAIKIANNFFSKDKGKRML